MFDGLGGDFLRRQHLVQLVHRDVAAVLGPLDELDPGVGEVEQRSVAGGGGFGVSVSAVVAVLIVFSRLRMAGQGPCKPGAGNG